MRPTSHAPSGGGSGKPTRIGVETIQYQRDRASADPMPPTRRSAHQRAYSSLNASAAGAPSAVRSGGKTRLGHKITNSQHRRALTPHVHNQRAGTKGDVDRDE